VAPVRVSEVGNSHLVVDPQLGTHFAGIRRNSIAIMRWVASQLEKPQGDLTVSAANNSEGRLCALAAFATMPYFGNLRLIESPEEAYLGDSGLVSYLVGLTSMPEVERSPFLGPLSEGFVAAEIFNRGYFCDQQGLEVDFVIPRPNAKLVVEAVSAKRRVIGQRRLVGSVT
jgi:hypothetical protein